MQLGLNTAVGYEAQALCPGLSVSSALSVSYAHGMNMLPCHLLKHHVITVNALKGMHMMDCQHILVLITGKGSSEGPKGQ